MKVRRNLRSRKSRHFRQSAYDGSQRTGKWPAWKKNAALVRHISLLK